ncbi:MAG: YHS domain-containing protein [Acidimicrobiales bacterium]|nr:YHS domain-containing protein [Acidimicrobiales bacterium]
MIATVPYLLVELGRGFREALYMFWETLWPLVLGFSLSGAVQAFVSREALEKKLGKHTPAHIARASGFGMVSSSCSYAASAMAKTLFSRGADYVSSMVFMFASTNLVIELGIVLIVLIGWQFAASEFIGGLIMIGIFAVIGPLVFKSKTMDSIRLKLTSTSHDEAASCQVDHSQQEPIKSRANTLAGWSDAASYAMADLTMLKRELLIGYTIAGFLAALVPHHVWSALFLRGHGGYTDIENALIGPFIAVISFVCSIGNIPLAAALWVGGISFGGVVSFIFADLISTPLLLIYRKYYGTKTMLKMLGSFWLVMSLAGLITQYIFKAANLIPTEKSNTVLSASFSWNYTTYLNILFLIMFAGLYYLYRNQHKLGGGGAYALDPVCGMQVETAMAPAKSRYDDEYVYFCSDRCKEKFDKSPNEYLTEGKQMKLFGKKSSGEANQGAEMSGEFIDPVCKMTVSPTDTTPTVDHEGTTYYFCNQSCADSFGSDPNKYLEPTKK